MRGWWRIGSAVVLLGSLLGVFAIFWWRFSQTPALPLAVPNGDQEIAWLHNPTSFETWENFVWGVKRAEIVNNGGPDGLEVDDSRAFPSRTTEVPEVVISRHGYSGKLRIRWYKFTNQATQVTWVNALSHRDPPPLAVIGGWSSDRAHELAEAMRNVQWSGAKPVLLLTQATADVVYPEELDGVSTEGPNLIAVYERSFRFCFTNRQMAEAVTDFILSDPSLRPGTIGFPDAGIVAIAPINLWVNIATVATKTLRDTSPLPAFTVAWNDDPYSTDLNLRFRETLRFRASQPRLQMISYTVPFSTGRLNRPNRAESEVADHILNHLPPLGTRSILVLPTVSAPARRTLRALVQGDPKIGRRLVAITGDGISVNTFFRDRDYAWPIRSLPVPIVLFTHANPFGWDIPGIGKVAPPGYELNAPRQGEVRTTTEDIRLFGRLADILTTAVFLDGRTEIVASSDEIVDYFRRLTPSFFDPHGNRMSNTGEHVVVLRPTFPGDVPGPTQRDGTLEVYTRLPGSPGWTLIHTLQLGRPYGGSTE